MKKSTASELTKLYLAEHISYDSFSPENGSGKITLGLDSFPFLEHHGFQDMIILPGSFYVEIAASIYKNKLNKVPGIITDINFNNLVSLSGKDSTSLYFNFTKDDSAVVNFRFREVEKDNTMSTTISVNHQNSEQKEVTVDLAFIDEFIQSSDRMISADVFYSDLMVNSNQYGPSFRLIDYIWLSQDTAVASFNFSKHTVRNGDFILDPMKLDTFTQMLSSLNDSKGRTFILNSIGKIIIYNSNLTGDIYCMGKVTRRENDGKGFIGELTVFDKSSGRVYLQFTDVRLSYLENLKSESQNNPDTRKKIYVSATFTAEPVERSLSFWNNYFGNDFRIEFAPYNQVFQELLNPSGLLSTNRDGINTILLNIEDWANNTSSLVPDFMRLESLFKDKARYTLPNNLEIVHLNKYETEYVYKEIFVDKCYLRHGIKINDGDTVIDIGANIGLFTLFVNQFGKNIKVFSYEPSPEVYNLLKLNSEAYSSKTTTFNCGVSDSRKNAQFTFYKNSSVFSGFQADEDEDKEAILTVVRNMLLEVADRDSTEEYIAQLTRDRMESELINCQLISVADIIADNSIDKIDLLKIDAEKSELAILNGIGEKNWEKIKQIVIEIHDKTGNILKEVQTILDEKGFSISIEEEKLLRQSGLYNIYAVRKGTAVETISQNLQLKKNSLEENCFNFYSTLSLFMKSSQAPMIVGICPPSPSAISEPELNSIFIAEEQRLIDNLTKIKNVFVIRSSAFLNVFNLQEYFDNHSNELGHIPYTDIFYSSLGTLIYRKIFSIKRNIYKVIALDCDNTIWKGVCGEDGVTGIQISESYKFLQQFMVNQIEAGMLVCLCSKNNEEDVFEIFDKRDDMILKRDHLVSWKLNWKLKSDNLKVLAEELNLGLDSFIFIDDNPVECGEVKINCPGVLTLQLPQDESQIKKFLENIWAFDHAGLSQEDKKRTKMYKENLEREKYRESGMSLQDFLIGLNLNIKISPPTEEQISRVSQLTFRTNQFNFTTIRRTESEVNNLLSKDNSFCLIAEVSDRFGDYGLVGVLFYTFAENSLKVDTFLLSCRVLGRGVEHRILSELGKVAEKNNLEKIEIKYIPSPKNRPALDFIEKVGSDFKSVAQNGFLYTIPTEHLINLKYEPSSENQNLDSEKSKIPLQDDKVNKIYSDRLSEKIQEIANHYNSLTEIYEKVETFNNILPENEPPVFSQPLTGFEEKIFNIWQKVLVKNNFGLNDNFFEIGGTSLRAVQLIASIKKELKITISIVTLFECPTIKLLSKKLNQASQATEPDLNFDEQVERGNKRRQQSITRKRK